MTYRMIIIAGLLQFALSTVTIAESIREMVQIPEGSFVMGFDKLKNSLPKHKIDLDSFYIDKYEVTQDDYKKLMKKNPSATKERLELTEKIKYKSFKPKNPVAPVGDKYPVTGITWFEAAAYCNARSIKEGLEPCYDEETWECDFTKNGYRLPTEAEWEYACRAGTDTMFYFGDDRKKLKEYASCWLEGEEYYDKKLSYRHKHERAMKNKPFIWNKPFPRMLKVGDRKPNNWGLYDMLGNAQEWCNDWYRNNYYKYSPMKNPRGPDKGEWKVVRGGAYNTIGRCGQRTATSPTDKNQTIGFRCVRNAPKEDKDKDDENDNKKEKSEKSDKKEAPE